MFPDDPVFDARALRAVPLFPLPSVVLFPRAVLPLHIFEQRYRDMTRDILDGAGCLAMAMLRPGWEKHYHGRPEIEPVVCVGSILAHEKLPDGCYNFLLKGQLRARIVDELPPDEDRLYRVARLEPLEESCVLEIDLSDERRRIERVLAEPTVASTPFGEQFATIVASPIPTADLADLLAFTTIDDVALKQSLLAETDVVRRVRTVVEALEATLPRLRPAGGFEPNLN